MSLSDVGKVCLFSSMSGTVHLDGEPLAGVRLVRVADRDGAKTDETTTDKNGYFEFPAVYERTISKFLPQEFVARQEITAHYAGEKKEIWWGVKRQMEENSEARGKPLVVTCELNSEEKTVMIGSTSIHSLCVWDVESDPPANWSEEGLFDSDSDQ